MEINKFNNSCVFEFTPYNALQIKNYALDIQVGEWNEISAHFGYYEDNIKTVTLDNGNQLIYADSVLVGFTDDWSIEQIDNEYFAKHSYPNGVCVYTSETFQFWIQN